ncbi:WD repeat and HMG-box DNA-binding protein 1-like [Pollicipes pollicipes]|uniref:WD repeat and HMG-box DNA-binding protein 1-like n=1 Tax=Pollicipes pollicipes TaxID=41117 RepID=UPI001884FF6E|nr:WD repeat and HMG-box DNA-binding protein 1-like [Pollicipes pollicipes]
MASAQTYVRYAHPEGPVGVLYLGDGSQLATVGCDGELRLWRGVEDDDPDTHPLGDTLTALAAAGPRLLVGTDAHAVAAFRLPGVQPDGVLTRYTAPVTDIHAAGELVASAGCDMVARVSSLDGERQLEIDGFGAPVLSVALDPRAAVLLTTCCDGRVGFWDARSGRRGVRLFSGADWAESGRLASALLTKPVTACAFSPCGRFVAAATQDGLLVEWRLGGAEARRIDQHEAKLRLNALCWHPDGDRLAFSDCAGQLGVTSGVRAGRDADADADADAPMDLDSLQAAIDDDDDERDLLEAALDGERNTLEAPTGADSDDDDENVISLRKIKAESGFVSDEESGAKGGESPAFQPGSTPAHLERRFLAWNSVGVVTAHDEESIDVEFHDSAVHHPLHLRNALGHTLAALSDEALLLAAPGQDDQPAKLQCLHFGSWDSNKEWYLDLAAGEEPEAAALGAGWLAVATSHRLLRLLTLTGVQRHVLSLSGPVVCLAGWEDRLLIVQHAGTGLPGEQSLTAQVLSAAGRRPPRVAPAPVPVPLAPRARLAWAGFTDQGTPCVSDTSGALRLLTGQHGAAWTPLEAPHPGADHLFVVSVSELEQTARVLLCRGSRFPAVLPRPALSLLPLRLPLAEPDTARGRLEEEAVRARLLLDALGRLGAAGFDTDEARVEPRRARAAALTQLFALAVRTDREHRALDVAAQMEEVSTVEAVAGYASRQRRALLADRLVRLAQTLADAPPDEDEAEEEDEPRPNARREEPPQAPGRQEDPAEMSAEEEEQEEDADSVPPTLPDLQRAARPASPVIFTPSPRNPFKCATAKAPQAGRGASVFDDIKRQQASTKRVLPEGKAKVSAKLKRPRVSKEAAGKLTSSIRSAFVSKLSSESVENVENTEPISDKEQEKTTVNTDVKTAPKAGSGLAKLSAFAFSDD